MHSRRAGWLMVLFASASLAPTVAHADCTYDEATQLQRIVSLAQRVNGQVGAGGHSVRWREGQTTIEVVYGGCDHLGHSVTRETPAAAPMGEAELLALAERMALEQWAPAEAEMLRNALREQRFTRSQSGAESVLNLSVPDYFEFAITQRHAHGSERVRIHWGRNF